MAQPIDIQIERSLTSAPTTLLYGEPAWSDNNEKLYVGNSSGTPVLINIDGKNSIEINAGEFQLVNDELTPGANELYSTDALGIRGWQPITNLISSADLAAVKSLRTTAFIAPNTWEDVEFDSTEIENTPTILDHDNSLRDRFTFLETGLYYIELNGTASGEIAIRFRLNDTTVISSGQVTSGINDLAPISATSLVEATSNDFISVQIQRAGAGNNELIANATFKVIRLKGSGSPGPQGVQGPPGNDGAAGNTGFGIYAWQSTSSAGLNQDGIGLSVIRNSTGSYTYTFDVAVTNTSYAVDVRAYDAGLSALNTFVNNRTLTGFDVAISIGDNGSTPDVATDADHTVTIIGPGSGAASGFNTIAFQNDGITVANTPHGTANFSSNFTVTDVGTGIVDIDLTIPSVFSIIKVQDNGGTDLATNYNINGPEIALLLRGTVNNFGSSTVDFTNTNGSITCNFTGVIRVIASVPHTSSGSRNSLKSIFQINGVNVGGAAYSYIRNSGGHNKDNNAIEEILSVAAGDIIRVGMRRSEGSSNGTATNLLSSTSITIQRLS